MRHLEKTSIQLGYIPLLDCVAILWAKQRGFFDEAGLDVTLVREASWASLRDRLAYGFLDAAHCLSAMLPAAAMGIDQLGIPFKTPLVLSINRAFISLSQQLCFQLDIHASLSPGQSAEKIVQALKQHDLQFAHVFKHSIHHYCLREWLALACEQTAAQIKLHTLPPPYMVEAISKQSIDGFCVGEPWNTQGELLGVSQIVASSQAIIPEVADKVLAVTADWARQHPNSLTALTEAIIRAQDELKKIEDFSAVWQLLMDYQIIQFNCSEAVHVRKYHLIRNIVHHFICQSAVPSTDDFYWLIQQMKKWDGVEISEQDTQNIIEQCVICPETPASS
ncbi:ABC transporter substrate-binding protein [Acinetobacter sp. WZC-1]|uniref:ABC transporter substrate-binding protein n=1 Tax=Acinetobacter sp. WZC-1 TaxID=3459034 RepID=UPI00403DA20A